MYLEVSCCHVTAILSSATKRGNSSWWFQTLHWFPFMKQPEISASFCLLVLGSYIVELGLCEERIMYLKRKFCNSDDSMLGRNDKMRWLFSFFLLSLSLRLDSFYHIMQLGVTVYFLWLTWLICDVTQWLMSTWRKGGGWKTYSTNTPSIAITPHWELRSYKRR